MLPLKWQEGRQPRRLLCFSAAFFLLAVIFSLLFGRGLSLRDTVLYSGIAATVLAMSLVLLLREQFRIGLPVVLGLLAGWLWCCGYGWLIWSPAQQYDQQTGQIRLELTEYAKGYDSFGTAFGVVTEMDGVPCRLNVKAYLKDGSPSYMPGDVLLFEGTLQSGRQDFSRNLLQEGYFLTLRQTSDTVLQPGAAGTLLRRMSMISHDITQRCSTLLPGNEGALLAALLSGNRDGFSDEFDKALTTSGTRHITAVSGLHSAILAGVLIQFFGKRAGLLLAIPAAVAYAAIVGFTPSVIRATVLLLFWTLSFLVREEKDSMTAMAAALLLLTAYNPFSVLGAGLLLSFAATLGLILLSAPLSEVLHRPFRRIKSKLLRKLMHYFVGVLSASIAATLFTMPLNILFFDTVPLMGLLSNVLILWAVALVMVLGCLVLGILLIFPQIAGLLAIWVLRWPLLWMTSVITAVGNLQFAATDSASLTLAIFSLLLLVAMLLWRGKLISGRIALYGAAILLCIAVIFTAGERKLFGTVEVYNSGGQPVILLRNEGTSMLNCGTRVDLAAELMDTALRRWNLVQPETILCTTGNYKTQAGLSSALEHVQPQRLLLPAEKDTIHYRYEDAKPITFTDSGTIMISGTSIQLLKAEEQTFALRLLAKDFSMLSLCGINVEDARMLVQTQVCSADLLLIDDRLMSDWQMLYDVCTAVQPQEILLISGGFSEASDHFSGIPVTQVENQPASYRFWR